MFLNDVGVVAGLCVGRNQVWSHCKGLMCHSWWIVGGGLKKLDGDVIKELLYDVEKVVGVLMVFVEKGGELFSPFEEVGSMF